MSINTSLTLPTQTLQQEELSTPEFIGLKTTIDSWLQDPQATGDKLQAAQEIYRVFKNQETTLDLSGKKLNKLPVNFLHFLPQLQIIKCANNSLTTFEISNRLTDLVELNLESNNITEIHIPLLNKLQWLTLSSNDLNSLRLEGPLPELKYLHIHNNFSLSELPMMLGLSPYLAFIETEFTPLTEDFVNTILNSCENLRQEKLSIDELQALLQIWIEFSADPEIDLSHILSLDNEKKKIIYEWLFRISKSSDFQLNQVFLAKVVCGILADFRNEKFQELAITQMFENNRACQDRASMALNELYLSWKLLCEIQTSSLQDQLQLILRAGRTLALRDAIGIELSNISDQNESVETYLYYEIKFSQILNLLTCIQSMSYSLHHHRLNNDVLRLRVEENFLKKAADIPVLDLLIESDLEAKNELSQLLEEHSNTLEALLQKDHLSDQEMKIICDDCKLKKEQAILEFKINWLRNKSSDL